MNNLPAMLDAFRRARRLLGDLPDDAGEGLADRGRLAGKAPAPARGRLGDVPC